MLFAYKPLSRQPDTGASYLRANLFVKVSPMKAIHLPPRVRLFRGSFCF